jgi:hypothetical protein
MFRLILILIFVFEAFGTNAQNRLKPKSNQPYYVSVNPFAFFRDGVQLNIDIALNERTSIQFSRSDIFTYDPRFITNGSFFVTFESQIPQINVILQSIVYQQQRVALKYALTKKGRALDGFYWGPALQAARYSAIIWEDELDGTSLAHVVDRAKYFQFGLIGGWQKPVKESGYLDIGMHMFFNSFSNSTTPMFSLDAFGVNKEIPFFVGFDATMGTSFLAPSYRSEPVSTHNYRHGLTFDPAAILRGGIRVDYHLPFLYPFMLNFNGGYYKMPDSGVTIITHEDLEDYTGYSVGTGIRMYQSGRSRLTGPFAELSYEYNHFSTHYEFSPFRGAQGGWRDVIYEMHNVGFSIGLSRVLANRYLLEGFVSNQLNLTNDKFRKRYPSYDFTSALRTEVGFRVGIAL